MRVRVSGTFWPQRPAAVPPSTTVTVTTRTTRLLWRYGYARLAGVSPRLSLVFSHHVCGTFPYSAHYWLDSGYAILCCVLTRPLALRWFWFSGVRC